MESKFMKILNSFKSKKILVIGDIMLDKYIWGDVSRISPEAPVQIVNAVNETYAPGGASNVANNISALSGKAYMIGIVGNDDARTILINDLKSKSINTDGIIIDNDKPTIQKIRIMGRGQQLLRVDYEKKEHVHKKIELQIKDFISLKIKDTDVVVISDYAKGVITKEIAEHIVKLAIKHNKPLIVDPKPAHREFYRGATLITPNNAEASEMSGIDDGSDESSSKIGKKLLKDMGTNVLLTRGEKGMSLFEKNGNTTNIPAKAKEVYSLTGAGDTVVATAALALASGATMKEAAYLANIAAGIKVGKIGTATVTLEEIKKEL
ncbi:MAG: D-glycero-beta-D-manno-heptose-7-phosphate kinase [Nanoarchaeota archaeon]